MKKLTYIFGLISILILATACSGGSGFNTNSGTIGAKTHGQVIAEEVAQMVVSGTTLTLRGTLVADLSSSTPLTSIYGTVKQGQTLNVLTDGDLEFLVYGEDGVFAAECEVSTLDPTYGPSHPLCQTAHAESYNTIIVCFANTKGAAIMTAQNWVGPTTAFDEGHGMICYQDGVKMLSSHIYTY